MLAGGAVLATLVVVAPASADGQDTTFVAVDDSGAPLGPAVGPSAGDLAPPPAANFVEPAPEIHSAIAGLLGNSPPAETNWGATSLGPSAAWDVSAQTGTFAWSYPLLVPPSPAGPAPDLALSYSSAAVDGRVASTNNQTSWIGEGWDLTSGYIERTYIPCADPAEEGTLGTGDLCWSTDNATIVFGGSAGPMVKDATSNAWHLRADDGTRVEHLTDGFNTAAATDYWKLITTDGTQYFFGRGQRSAADRTQLNSAWTVPVFGNDAGEPCNDAAGFASSWCQMVWRWNLEYVVDTSGNTMTYFYDIETNHYGRNNNAVAERYDRSGYLSRIEYGQTVGNEYTPAPIRVDFTVAERCLIGDCANLTGATKASWPDVPQSLICDSAASCPQLTYPAFFTRKRLVQVTTSIYGAGGHYSSSGYTTVDTWQLSHQFNDPGDNTTSQPNILWLASIKHTGNGGDRPDIFVGNVTFEGNQFANRVDTQGDGYSPMRRFRLTAIHNESGGVISINYRTECSPTSLPASQQTNTMACFPVRWDPEGPTPAVVEYFHKYLVTSVITNGGGDSPATETSYEYADGAAWHLDDTSLTPDDKRTWNQFRGYGKVTVTTGATSVGNRPATTYRYFRGMDGDHLDLTAGGPRRSVLIDGINDVDAVNGMVREETVHNGAATLTASLTTPWVSAPTATDANGVTAQHVGVATTTSQVFGTQLPGGARTTRSDVSYDTYGMPIMVQDRGDVSTTAYDRCTRTEYARNTAANILSTVKRTETVSVACGTTPQRPGDVIADTRVLYDDGAYGAAPTRGLATKTQRLGDVPGTTPPSPTVPVVPAFVQQAGDHGTSRVSLAVTPNAVLGSGNRLVVQAGVFSNGGATAASVSDSAGDHFTRVLNFLADDGTEMSVWTAPVTAGAGSRPDITLTATSSADIAIVAAEYSGLSTIGTGAEASVHDVGTTSSAATVSSGSTAVITGSNRLAIGFFAESGWHNALTADGAFAQRANLSPTGDMELLLQDTIVTAGTAVHATVGTGGNTPWAAAVVVFAPETTTGDTGGESTMPAFVQQAGDHGTSRVSLAVTPNAVLGSGNRLVVQAGVFSNGGATAASVSDSAGDQFTRVLNFLADDGTEMSVWTAPVTAGAGSRPDITLTATSSADIAIVAAEYSGLSTIGTGAEASVHDVGTTSSAATVSSGSTAVITGSNRLAIGFFAESGWHNALTADGAFAQRANLSPTGDMELLLQDTIVTAGTAVHATVGTGGNTPWAAAVVVFAPETTTGDTGGESTSVTAYVTVSTTEYDDRGRVTSQSDALDRRTRTEYTQTSSGLVTAVVTKSPDPDGAGPLAALETTTHIDPAWGTATSVNDPNGKTTTATLDALGRITAVWRAGRVLTSTPSITYAYSSDLKAVTTKTLAADETYRTTVSLSDGLGRPRQTQTDSANATYGGRVITDTVYDSRGLVDYTNDGWYAPGPPTTNLVVSSVAVPARTVYDYDAAGRVTAKMFLVNEDALHPRWRTTTLYDGDRTTVTPPAGGTPTTTIIDARGQTTELRRYTGGVPSGAYQAVTYGYDPAGRLSAVHDTVGTTWTYHYDMLGRQVSSGDPDKGPTTTSYDLAGQVTTTTDARGKVLGFTYDQLGRTTARYQLDTAGQTITTGTKLASWTYDTVAKGQLTSSTRYDASGNYTTAVTGFDDAYRPLGQTVSLPAGLADGLATSYQTDYTYTVDGQVETITLPAAGNLEQEAVHYYFDQANQLEWMGSGRGWGTYVSDSTWSSYGQLLQTRLGTTWAYFVTNGYEHGTRRLASTKVNRQGATGLDMDLAYTYDDAGNPTSVVDTSGTVADRQCFNYDRLGHLTQAWTAAAGACAAPTSWSNVGGPAPYWQQYAYSATGDRQSVINHTATGTSTSDYAYQATTTDPVHGINTVTTTGSTTGTAAFTYDPTGNTLTRTVNGTEQRYTWDADGHLAVVDDDVTLLGHAAQYIYSADGTRLIRTQGGATTVYLPGGQEVTASNGTVTAQRTYTFNGATVAVRTGPSNAHLWSLVSDPHQSATIAINNAAKPADAVTKRRMDPWGNPRGTAGAWPTDRGFLNKPVDDTGLTSIGARYYDGAFARFISVDPIMNLAEPDQWNAYAYANNNPITNWDPTGLIGMTLPDGRRSGNHAKANPQAKPNYSLIEHSYATMDRDSASDRHAFIGMVDRLGSDDMRGWDSSQQQYVWQARFDVSEMESMCDTWSNVVQCGTPEAHALGAANLGLAFDLWGAGSLLKSLRSAISGTARAANTGPDLAQGFRSFSQAKRSLPSPGQGNVYDHVVEQSQIAASRSGFDPRLIHNPANLNPVPAAVNQAKANYYSSIRPFTGGQTVRNWLNGQTFGQQHTFGMEITSLIQRGASLP